MKKFSLHKPTIISVDDDPDILFAIKAVMQSFGFTVRSSLNGQNLWELIGNELPDAILLDIQMKGISGDSLCQILKHSEATKNIPVILLSGNDNIGQVANACGADAFIQKPFTGNVMNECIVKLMEKRRA